ncbi:MAG TPA: hypothetical protein VJG30_04235 [Candidatus Nanoarchaeia archaeon]|nr:hypothetical protein [Candidatus Nanoarchaeia archaeon]
MKRSAKNILLAAGVLSSILGITFAIPSFIKEIYSVAIISTIFIIGGMIIIAFSLGE